MALEYTRYRIEFVSPMPQVVPDFLAGAIRATFGKVLRELTCVTGAPTCAGCSVAPRCLYRALFDPLPPAGFALAHGSAAHAHTPPSEATLDPSNGTRSPAQRVSAVPAPYVFDLDDAGGFMLAPGRPLELGLTLIGRAREHLQLAVLALERAARLGLARTKLRLELAAVRALDRDGRWVLVLDEHHDKLRNHVQSAWLDAPLGLPGDDAPRRLGLTLATPCRLTQAGEVAQPHTLKARTWLLSLIRRLNLLSAAHGDAPLGLDVDDLTRRAAESEITYRNLRWRRLPRWSSAQRREMPFDGLVGELVIEGPLSPFVPLVDFAAPLHVGKHANFGLGRFQHVWH